MTGVIYEFLGHKMLMEATGGTLTRCAWIPSDRVEAEPSILCQSISEEAAEVIGLAVRQISEYIAGARREFSVPLHLKGTDFRLKVWDELRKIPFGATVTYKELAARIGSPKACRAVANACGSNPFPILIPCHRVVASGGRVGGYTGGLDIKLALLELEGGGVLSQHSPSGKKKIV